MRKFGLESIARGCAHHPWKTLAVWAVLLIGAAAVTVMYLGGALSNEQSFTNDPESSRALAVVNDSFPGSEQTQELVIVRSPELTVDDERFREQVHATSAQVLALGPEVVVGGIDYTKEGVPVSDDIAEEITIYFNAKNKVSEIAMDR